MMHTLAAVGTSELGIWGGRGGGRTRDLWKLGYLQGASGAEPRWNQSALRCDRRLGPAECHCLSVRLASVPSHICPRPDRRTRLWPGSFDLLSAHQRYCGLGLLPSGHCVPGARGYESPGLAHGHGGWPSPGREAAGLLQREPGSPQPPALRR